MDNRKYEKLSHSELVTLCEQKDNILKDKDNTIHRLRCLNVDMLTKNDIMSIYNCENNKALRILRVMFQMGYGNKIGKEYYVSKEAQLRFIKDMTGKEVFV